MPRSRMVKPEFFDDEKLSEISRDARLLFIGLWVNSDDYGVVKGNHKWLKSKIYPYDEISPHQFTKWIKELEAQDCIRAFKAKGENYYWIRTFSTHQTINNPSKAKNPSPPESLRESYRSPTVVLPFETEIETEVKTETEIETEEKTCPPPEPDGLRRNGLSINDLAKLWNERAPQALSRVNLPFSRPEKKLKPLKAILSRHESNWWFDMLNLLPQRPFLLGVNDRGWRATFDFVVEHAEEIMDGKYSGTKAQGQTAERAIGPMTWLAKREAKRGTEG